MKKYNNYCLICGNKASNKVDLGSFHLSMSFINKLEVNNKKSLNTEFHYLLNECHLCNYFWLAGPHPSSSSGKEIIYYDLRINSNEPEGHFDKLLNWFGELNILKDKQNFTTVSYKDITLVDKLAFKEVNSCLFNESDLLNINKLINDKFYQREETLIKENRIFDFISARHVLEHISNPYYLIKFLDSYLKSEGIIYFELPSPKFMLEKGLSYFVWEEHISYFSLKSLKNLFNKAGFFINIKVFENGLEPIICIIASRAKLLDGSKNDNFNDANLSLLKFHNKHLCNMKKIISFLKIQDKKVYFLGAGHLGIKAVSFFKIENLITGFVDDMKIKQNKISKANGLKIYSSSNISPGSILIHVLPPESIIKVRKNKNYQKLTLVPLSDIID